MAKTGTVTFLAGQTEAVVTVTVLSDLAAENDETFGITLTGAVVGATPVTASATATIRNDDIPGVSIEASSASKAEGNGGATAFTFTISRAGSTGSVQSVSYAVQGSGANAASATDFQGSALPGGSVTFAAGEVSKTITIFVNGDTVVEADEAFNVTLSNPSPGLNIVTAAATGLIQNDDASVSIAALSATKPEGNSGSTSYTFTVTRSGNLGLAQSVSYGVSGTGANPATGSDFQGNAFPTGLVSFAAGEAARTIAINVQGDTTAEAAESFLISLTGPSAGLSIAAGSAVGTITNDEPVALGDAYVTLQQQPLTIGTTASVVINDQVSAPLTTSLVSGTTHGTLQLAGNGSFTYSPTTGFAGVDSFTYRANGVEGQTNVAEALIYVTPVQFGASTTLNLLTLSPDQQIASTYIAFFGRAADAGGLTFWVGEFVRGLPTQGPATLFAPIASSFGVSSEAKALYPFLTNPFGASAGQISAFLDSVYNNLFNRSSDPGGLSYWTGQIQQTLAAGQFVGSVLVNIMSGAQDTAVGKDITRLMGKVAVSLAFVREQQEHGTIWAGASDTAAATQLLDPVSSDPASVLIGIRNADAYIAAHPCAQRPYRWPVNRPAAPRRQASTRLSRFSIRSRRPSIRSMRAACPARST